MTLQLTVGQHRWRVLQVGDPHMAVVQTLLEARLLSQARPRVYRTSGSVSTTLQSAGRTRPPAPRYGRFHPILRQAQPGQPASDCWLLRPPSLRRSYPPGDKATPAPTGVSTAAWHMSSLPSGTGRLAAYPGSSGEESTWANERMLSAADLESLLSNFAGRRLGHACPAL
jgi:hypothetical protein